MLERIYDLIRKNSPHFCEGGKNPKHLDVLRGRDCTYWEDRLSAQLKFALLLSETKDNQYHQLVEETISYVMTQAEVEGVITPAIVEKAEEKLSALKEASKSYDVICAAHAHIDMNWQWGWDETVTVVMDTVGTMLQIMEEYPDYKFSQSQASVYKILEDYAPEMLAKVKELVHQGRWEVTAATWVEHDTNMPSGESQVRQILYAKKYLSNLLEIDEKELNIDYEPDTFGHTLQVPEILSEAGIKYCYHCRGRKGDELLYRWVGPSGAEVIMNREANWYLTDVNSDMGPVAVEVSNRIGMKTTLRVFGVGDHGGGPTRRDVERIIDMNTWPIFPSFRFGTYKQYFSEVEKIREKLPVIKGEQNLVFDGCYSSHSKIKDGNRKAENDLFSSELYSSIIALNGMDAYPAKEYEGAWRKVILNHFHDIITGAGVPDTRDHALGLYQEVRATSNSRRKRSLRKIIDRIDTSSLIPKSNVTDDLIALSRAEGAGAGSSQAELGIGKTRVFHIFNPSQQARQEVARILLWDWHGDTDRIVVEDHEGNVVPHQLVSKGYNQYWGHDYMTVLVAAEVPPMGYSTYKLSEGSVAEIPLPWFNDMRQQEAEEFILENQYLKVMIHSLDGSIQSVIDKSSGQEVIDSTARAGIFQYIMEANHKSVLGWNKGMSAWLVGRYKNVDDVNKNLEITSSLGPLRQSVTLTGTFSKSKLEVTISLNENSRFLEYDVSCDWLEVGTEEVGIPRLTFHLPTGYENPLYKCDVPFGMIERENRDIDIPASSMVTAVNRNGKGAITMISRDRYGWRLYDDAINLVLLRSGYDPNPYPEYGVCKARFKVGFFPETPENSELLKYSRDYNLEMTVLSNSRHEGSLPLHHSYAKVVAGSAILSAMKGPEVGEDNELIVRLYDVNGKNDSTTIAFERKIKEAKVVDITENEVGALVGEIKDNLLTIAVKPYKVHSVKVVFEPPMYNS